MFGNQYRGKRVFLTGHTGFKGAWLSEWLTQLGAEVTGFSDIALPPPSLFSALGLEDRIRHVIGDVRDASALAAAMRESKPDFVFHLAAQSLVRSSYRIPAETFAVNVMGTVNVLDAIRNLPQPTAAVIVTSDKCYENREQVHSYREEDPLGGFDPYSASKGCAEIVVSSYRRSFLQAAGASTVASARAGNVIGGGDWAEHRIVPDCVRALLNHEAILVRRPASTRPWQHVLEPLSGYLWLGALISANDISDCTAYNFGPDLNANRSVSSLVAEILKHWPGSWVETSDPASPHEAGLLNLAIDKAFHHLRWKPVWPFEQAVEATVRWYRDVAGGKVGARRQTLSDIQEYSADAQGLGVEWARF